MAYRKEKAHVTVCAQLQHDRGIAAVVGPPSTDGALAVRSVCNSVDVPHVDTRRQFGSQETTANSISLYPHARFFSSMLTDVVRFYKWTKVTVMYEEEEALERLQGILEASDSHNLHLTFLRMTGTNHKGLLKRIKTSGANHIIVDCRRETLPYLLDQMLELQMLRSYFHYLFVSLDLYLMNMSRYTGDKVNLTTLHMLSRRDPATESFISEWNAMQFGRRDSSTSERNQSLLTTEAALMYDAVSVIANGLQVFTTSRNESNIPSLSCFGEQTTWEDGLSFYNFLQATDINGLTGPIKFDKSGERAGPRFYISELQEDHGFKEVGEWEPRTGIFMHPVDIHTDTNDTISNKTLVVTTILEPPYCMLRRGHEELSGKEKYEGFIIDFLERISELMKFNYVIKIVADDNYGSEMPDGSWNGMVGELIERKADLAVAPLTITYAREKVIDFSKPWMYLGVTILYRVPEPQNPGVFSFLNPLSPDVWLYVILAFILVSLVLFILARFSPYEWYNSHPCNPDYDTVENQFNFFNCLWFSFGGLMQQGSEINPRAFSTRVLSGFWWFFSLILISSYTANLAAFLTVERMVSPIAGADDLVKQTTIEYGTRKGGSTEEFFSRSKIPTYMKMWEFMSSRESVFSNTYEEGIQRVLNSKNYAFLMESSMAEYVISQHCQNLTVIGGLLNSRGYGIGTPLGSIYRDEVTKVILQLQEDDVLLELKNKWWNKDQCQGNVKQSDEANSLGLKNIGGIFLVLITGLVCGLIAAFAEFIWKSRQNAVIDKKSLCGEMMSELRFAFRCNTKRRNSKPVIEHKYIPATSFPPNINGRQSMQMSEPLA
ncbi:glutamate receptor ionotropic, kainate 2-like [Diadema setosum]|uniref:glutamate receptor ionotropic, kainate 2-like n=1 Tax=Diadema setosum TaxID=31175 RepID=UPI003B3A914C